MTAVTNTLWMFSEREASEFERQSFFGVGSGQRAGFSEFCSFDVLVLTIMVMVWAMQRMIRMPLIPISHLQTTPNMSIDLTSSTNAEHVHLLSQVDLKE